MELCLTHYGTVNYFLNIKTSDVFTVGFVDTFSHETLFILNAIWYCFEYQKEMDSVEVAINLFFFYCSI